MSNLIHHGKIKSNLDPLIKRIEALPDKAWVYRTDPESYKTASIRSSNPHWKEVEENIERILNRDVVALLGPGHFTRVVLSLIPSGQKILPHTDDFGEEVRRISKHCHIPLITHEDIKMGFGTQGEEHNLQKGHLYSMDETVRHYVNNDSNIDRVHLLFAHFKQ